MTRAASSPTVARRGGRWSLRAAAAATGISHRTARTVSAQTPDLAFPIGTEDLLSLRVLCEIFLASPPTRSERSLNPYIIEQRAGNALRLARQVWDGKALSALLVLTPTAAVLCREISDLPSVLRDLDSRQTVSIMPVGAWAEDLMNEIVE